MERLGGALERYETTGGEILMRGFWKFRTLWTVAAATSLLVPGGFGQSSSSANDTTIRHRSAAQAGICAESMPENAVKAALRMVCLRDSTGTRSMADEKAIIIGFVGGFVRSDSVKHPEVQFASYIQGTYPSEVHAEVFSNHDGKRALRRVLQLLSKGGDGVLTPREKQHTRIILYGHSWGGSQVVTFARELDRLEIPVSLTILVDSVHKPGHDDGVIPPNVQNAVNFYQTKGVIHGRSHIRAADPEHTNIIGNFQMTYRDRQINCDNYPWIARHLNRPHHEIENDPLVWKQIASMIDAQLFKDTSMVEASVSQTSIVEPQDQR